MARGTRAKADMYRESIVQERFGKEAVKSIASFLGIYWTTVYRIAKRLHLPCVGNQQKAERNDTCDIHYFDKWSPNMAYVLGLLFADGSVRGGSIGIDASTPDEETLLFVHKELKAKRPIRRFDYQNSSTGPFSRFAVHSNVMAAKLAELGLHPNKTFRDDPFPNVPEPLLGHFIRGYFDGDGGVGSKHRAMKIIGTPAFITGMHDILVNKAEMKPRKLVVEYGKRAKWIKIGWNHLYDLQCFYKFAYFDGQIDFCLKRKQDLMVKWTSCSENIKFCPPRYRRVIPAFLRSSI